MKKDMVKAILDLMTGQLKYNIMEVPVSTGIQNTWGIYQQVSSYEINTLTFWNAEGILNYDSQTSVRNFIKNNFSNFNVRNIDVLICDNRTNYNDIISEYEYMCSTVDTFTGLIIVDSDRGDIIYYSQNVYEIARQVGSCSKYYVASINEKEKFIPYCTYTIIAANILVFIICCILSSRIVKFPDWIMEFPEYILLLMGAKFNSLIDAGQYYRLITPMFLHAGLIHIALNMYALYCIGPLAEKVYGRINYVGIYFFSGIISSLASYIFSPSSLSVGASGAIFGLFGAILIFALRERDRIGKNLMLNMIFVIAINLLFGFRMPNIDNSAHLGGLVGGLISAKLASLMKQKNS